jgi:hypothetical protein
VEDRRVRTTETRNSEFWPLGDGQGIAKCSPLYIDPLHMPDIENQTPLTIAIGAQLRPISCHIKVRNARRKEMINMLLQAGADADLNLYRSPRAPAWENMEIRIETVLDERINQGWRPYELDAPIYTKQPFLCHGIVSSCKTRGGDVRMYINIRRIYFDVRRHDTRVYRL